jgi:two-component system NtrC family sensor kinase
LRLEPTDITTILDRAISSLPGIEIYKNYSPGIPPVRVDAELLERVFSNLILNASQASPPGGVVTVKTRLLDDKEVEVAVIDRGSGIEAKNLESIFNPFFTTKPEGVGLGLAICSKIVDEHGGHITVESTAGEGSVFRVILPV